MVPLRASRIWARAWRLASTVSAAPQSSGRTSVYPRIYASLGVNRTQISVARSERMRVRARRKTSEASRLGERKPESTALGRATELTGGWSTRLTTTRGKSGSDAYRKSRLTRHRLGGSPMIVRRSLGLTLGTLFILASAQGAWAEAATEQLKSAIDRVLATVDNPALRGDAKVPERRMAVRKIANEIFAFREVALRSLGRYWQLLS